MSTFHLFEYISVSTGMDVFLGSVTPAFLNEINKGFDVLSDIIDQSYKKSKAEDDTKLSTAKEPDDGEEEDPPVTLEDVEALAVLQYKLSKETSIKTKSKAPSSKPTLEDLRKEMTGRVLYKSV